MGKGMNQGVRIIIDFRSFLKLCICRTKKRGYDQIALPWQAVMPQFSTRRICFLPILCPALPLFRYSISVVPRLYKDCIYSVGYRPRDRWPIDGECQGLGYGLVIGTGFGNRMLDIDETWSRKGGKKDQDSRDRRTQVSLPHSAFAANGNPNKEACPLILKKAFRIPSRAVIYVITMIVTEHFCHMSRYSLHLTPDANEGAATRFFRWSWDLKTDTFLRQKFS